MKRARAKVFKTGGSQAVRLPKEFRVRGREVLIRRVGEAIILEPIRGARGWPDAFRAAFEGPPEPLIERYPQGKHEREKIDI